MQFPFSILEKFDEQILFSDRENKGYLLSRLFKVLVSSKEFQEWNEKSKESEIEDFYNSLSDKIEKLFLQTDFSLPGIGLEANLPYQNFIHYVFFLSKKLSTEDLQGQLQLNRSENDHSALLTLNPFNWEQFRKTINPVSTYFYQICVNLASIRIQSIPETSRFSAEILSFLQNTNVKIPEELPFSNLHLIWAMSSYMDQPMNQDTKIYLNSVFEESIQKNGLSLTPNIKYFKLTFQQKPRLLIIAEEIDRHHVINRCYGLSLSHLKKYFSITVLKTKDNNNNDHLNWADDIKEIDMQVYSLNLLVDLVEKLAPDVVLYTSVGLKMWGLILSRIRLAPLQITLPGHPDFPYSQSIDHIIGGHILFSRVRNNPKLVLLQDSPGSLFNIKDEPVFPKRKQQPERSTLRVVICANVFKLTHEFLKTIELIKNQLNTPAEWIFMQNLRGYHYRVGKKQIEMVLGKDDITVLPALKTLDYRKTLVSSDLLLSTFPFGGENTTLDALLAGLPVVSLNGPEPRQRLDYRVLQSVGLADKMCFQSRKEYINCAATLLSQPEQLFEYRQAVKSAEVRKKIVTETVNCQFELSETVYNLYKKRVDSL